MIPRQRRDNADYVMALLTQKRGASSVDTTRYARHPLTLQQQDIETLSLPLRQQR